MRARWGVDDESLEDKAEGQQRADTEAKTDDAKMPSSSSSSSSSKPGLAFAGGLVTPPRSPELLPLSSSSPSPLLPLPNPSPHAPLSKTSSPDLPSALSSLPKRAVILYVGRISWEKNLLLLLHAVHTYLPLFSASRPNNGSDDGSFPSPPPPPPKLVFVGDGPARVDLQRWCDDRGIDASFEGHRSGVELAICYASADVFAFPSFTETFGSSLSLLLHALVVSSMISVSFMTAESDNADPFAWPLCPFSLQAKSSSKPLRQVCLSSVSTPRAPAISSSTLRQAFFSPFQTAQRTGPKRSRTTEARSSRPRRKSTRGCWRECWVTRTTGRRWAREL
jgi:glycosyltransferase involved in cell wall biosynthesis